MKWIAFLVVIVLTMACGKKSDSSGNGATAVTPEILPAPLPANSAGVVVSDDPLSEVESFTIPARKKYNPTAFEDGHAYVTRTGSLILPARLPVVQGRPGNHLSFVTLTIASGVYLKCVYLGEGSNTANEYSAAALTFRFDFCVEASVSVTPGGRAALKVSAQNVLDASVRVSSPVALERGDRIGVSVNNSNRNGAANVTGEVLPVFELRY